jgi:hypothetical protein
MDRLFPPHTRQNDPNTSLFLGLYLLLLAFFAFLTAISNFEESKSRSVIESLSSTFSSSIAMGRGELIDPEALAAGIEGRKFHDKLAALFEESMPFARVSIPEAGRIMEVVFAAEDIFVRAGTAMRPERLVLADRLAAMLVDHPSDLRFEIEAIMGTRRGFGVADREAPDSELAIGRAGVLARALDDAGSPPGSVAVGLEARAPGRVRLRFYVRGKGSRPDFGTPAG